MYIPEVPINSLTKEIKEIVDLVEQLKENRRFVFNEPALNDDIIKWEKTNNVSIPESYADWLRFSNGSIIRGSLAEFYGLNEIEINVDGFPEDYVIIGELVGDGVILCFSKGSGKIFTDDHGKVAEYDNFNEILEELIYDLNAMW